MTVTAALVQTAIYRLVTGKQEDLVYPSLDECEEVWVWASEAALLASSSPMNVAKRRRYDIVSPMRRKVKDFGPNKRFNEL
jgi:hypothetical protein